MFNNSKRYSIRSININGTWFHRMDAREGETEISRYFVDLEEAKEFGRLFESSYSTHSVLYASHTLRSERTDE